jgi:hypothetical protein
MFIWLNKSFQTFQAPKVSATKVSGIEQICARTSVDRAFSNVRIVGPEWIDEPGGWFYAELETKRI